MSDTFKIVRIDNYARETVAEKLVAENIANETEAKLMCEALQSYPCRSHNDWFCVKPADYVLWRGMEELV